MNNLFKYGITVNGHYAIFGKLANGDWCEILVFPKGTNVRSVKEKLKWYIEKHGN